MSTMHSVKLVDGMQNDRLGVSTLIYDEHQRRNHLRNKEWFRRTDYTVSMHECDDGSTEDVFRKNRGKHGVTAHVV